MEIAEPAEKVCPDCAETVKSAARVCRFCGHRFDGSADASAASSRSEMRGRGILIWAAASGALMVIGSFGPWVESLGQSVAGTDASNDGWLVIAAAVAGCLFMYGTRSNRGAGLWALLAGVAGSITTIHDRSHASHAIAKNGLELIARIGWGLNLAMVASISLAVAGAVWLASVPSDPQAFLEAHLPADQEEDVWRCEGCGAEIDEQATVCPNCGDTFEEGPGVASADPSPS